MSHAVLLYSSIYEYFPQQLSHQIQSSVGSELTRFTQPESLGPAFINYGAVCPVDGGVWIKSE